MAMRLPAPEVCPVCHEDLPPRALACPQCGADHRSGWNELETLYDGLDLPEPEEEDEEVERAGPYLNSPRRRRVASGQRATARATGMRWLWRVTALVLLGWFLWMALAGW